MTETASTLELSLRQEFLGKYPDEATRHLEALPLRDIVKVLAEMPADAALPFWIRVTTDIGEQLLPMIKPAMAKEVLERLDPSRAGDLISGLEDDAREKLLALLERGRARNIRTVLAFPPGTAGAIMDPRVSIFRPATTVGEAIDRLIETGRKGTRFVWVVDGENRLQSQVEVQDLALSDHDVELSEVAQPIAAAVQAVATVEEVVDLIQEHRISNLPVLDIDGHLIGVVRHSAMVDAVQEDATGSFQTMVGASRDERALSKVSFAVRKRLPWMEINLLTAFLAASVVGLFESTIAKYTALAVLLPVVAGQSGNTGAQALAVVMRGLALREIQTSHWLRVTVKEAGVGFFNGVAVALTTGAGVYLWSQSAGLAAVITLAMVVSMVIAGIAGAAVPMVLSAVGQDPAQSSSIILTTVTDVAGFFSFLGIATLFAAML
jgi:magnesium transporter